MLVSGSLQYIYVDRIYALYVNGHHVNIFDRGWGPLVGQVFSLRKKFVPKWFQLLLLLLHTGVYSYKVR